MVDNSLRTLADQTRQFRERKNQIASEILESSAGENLNNRRIAISDGYLRFTTVEKVNPLTFALVQDGLAEFLGSAEQAMRAVEYIKSVRNRNNVRVIKRTTQ